MFKLILVALYFVEDLPREEDSEDEVLGACPGTSNFVLVGRFSECRNVL